MFSPFLVQMHGEVQQIHDESHGDRANDVSLILVINLSLSACIFSSMIVYLCFVSVYVSVQYKGALVLYFFSNLFSVSLSQHLSHVAGIEDLFTC